MTEVLSDKKDELDLKSKSNKTLDKRSQNDYIKGNEFDDVEIPTDILQA